MKKLAVVSTLLMMSCAGKNTGPDLTKPKLELKASKSAAGVSFYAYLSGNTNREYRFYCPEQLWEFGDGNSYHRIYKCADYDRNDPWLDKKLFRKFYEYKEGGVYKVKLTLMKNGKIVAVSQDYEIRAN